MVGLDIDHVVCYGLVGGLGFVEGPDENMSGPSMIGSTVEKQNISLVLVHSNRMIFMHLRPICDGVGGGGCKKSCVRRRRRSTLR